MLEVRRLKLLCELNRRGTLAAVAIGLHVSPSSVSQQLAQLEVEAGVPLLDHVGRGVRLTEAARMLVADAELVLKYLERAEAALASFDTKIRGTVRIASFQTATLALLPALLHRLSVFPELRIDPAQVEPEQAFPRLLDHDFDLVLGEEFPTAPVAGHAELARENFYRDPMWLATPRRDAPNWQGSVEGRDGSVGDGQIDLSTLSQSPWVLEPHGTVAHAWSTGLCRLAGFEPSIRFESADLLSHVALVESGHAVGFIPDLLPQHLRAGVALHPLPGEDRTIFTSVRRESVGVPSVRTVRSALRSVAERTVRNRDS